MLGETGKKNGEKRHMIQVGHFLSVPFRHISLLENIWGYVYLLSVLELLIHSVRPHRRIFPEDLIQVQNSEGGGGKSSEEKLYWKKSKRVGEKQKSVESKGEGNGCKILGLDTTLFVSSLPFNM